MEVVWGLGGGWVASVNLSAFENSILGLFVIIDNIREI